MRGRKGEYSTLLDDLAKQGFSRVRVDGIPVELSERAEVTLARYEVHTIEVVVDRLIRRDGIRQRLDRVDRDGARADRGHGRGPGHGRVGRRRRRRGHHVLPAPGLHPLRHQLRRARAAQLLLQLALRRLPGLRGAGDQVRGGPRAGRARRQPLAGRGRAGALGRGAQRVLHRAPGRRGRARRVRLRHAVEVAQGQGQEARPLRLGHQADPGHLQEPVRAQAVLRGDLRGHHPLAAAPARRGRVGLVPRADRAVHARGGLPGLPRGAPQARVAGRDRGRSQHLRAVQPAHQHRRRGHGDRSSSATAST